MSQVDYKRAAIEQWTTDPCESPSGDHEPGTRPYFEAMLRQRLEHAPWMPAAIGFAETTGLTALDVGCGQGLDVVQYAQAGARSHGIDLTPRHVELARMHLSAMELEAEISQGDAEALPYEDASFDRVSSNGVLHHTPGIEAAVSEIRRVLRPSGRATVIVYNRSSLHYWVEQVLMEGLVRGRLREEGSMEGVLSRGVERSSIGARPLVRVYSPRQVRRLLTEAGFVGVATEVRHFWPSDTFVTAALERRWPALFSVQRRGFLGRTAGWYVIGRGLRPAGG